MNDERPKPPRPTTPSEPTIRTTRVPSDPAIRAAGLSRPASASNPDLLFHEVKRHGQRLEEHDGRIGALEGASSGAIEHSGGVSEHLADQDAVIVMMATEFGFKDRLPERYRPSSPPPSDAPPSSDAKKPPKTPAPMLPKIEADSWKTKIAAYVGAAVVIAEGLWKVWTMIHGGK